MASVHYIMSDEYKQVVVKITKTIKLLFYKCDKRTSSSVKLAAMRGASQPGTVPKPLVIPRIVPKNKPNKLKLKQKMLTRL